MLKDGFQQNTDFSSEFFTIIRILSGSTSGTKYHYAIVAMVLLWYYQSGAYNMNWTEVMIIILSFIK